MEQTAMAGAATRRARNRREMRGVILDAARRIVAEQGAESLTMRAIGQSIGYSAAALYEYFPAKEDLFGCLFFEGSGGLAGRIRDALAGVPPSATAVERMSALGHAYRAFAHEQPDLFRMVFGNPTPEFSPGFSPRPPAAETEEEEALPEKDAFALALEVVRDGIAGGEFAPAPPVTAAIAAWATVHGFVMLELNGHMSFHPPPSLAAERGGEPPSPDELFAATLDLCMRGVVRR